MRRHDPAMENAMLSIRLAAAGAALIVAASAAAAQTATNTTPGKPIALLQVGAKPVTAKAKLHTKTVKKLPAKKHHLLARHRPAPPSAPIATAAAPATAWPALQPDAPPTLAVAAAEPPSQPSAAINQPIPSGMAAAGPAPHADSPDDVDKSDPGAGTPNAAADVAAAAATKSASAQAAPAVRAMVAAPAQQDTSPVGTASWIAQVLAAAGGAVAAGSVAWFLMASTPRRTYG
jgi:hypothetical protein